jgi:uncharacterized LabA/DUF88 family protein
LPARDEGATILPFSMPDKVAILLDGGFVKKRLAAENKGKFPQAQNIVQVCTDIMEASALKGNSLFRIFFYDAPPLTGKARNANPIDGSFINFSNDFANINKALLDSLELQRDFAVRRGYLLHQGWKLSDKFLKSLSASEDQSVTIKARDIAPDIKQKGVDLRIGLDIAQLAVKRIVDIIILVTGDSDLVPAMKLARKEGLRVYLSTLGATYVRRDLKAHADLFLEYPLI